MSCLGILFAVPEDVIRQIKFLPVSERPRYISEKLEELYLEDYPERTLELDTAWDAIHRSLTDGTLCFDCGEYPLGGVILGGELLYYDGERYDDYIITAKNPDDVKNIYTRLASLTKKQFQAGYDKIDETYPDERGSKDFENAWEYLQDSVPFFRLAAQKGLWVMFTAEV